MWSRHHHTIATLEIHFRATDLLKRILVPRPSKSSSHFLLEIPFVICSQWASLCWFVCVACVFVAIPATVLPSFVLVWSLLRWLSELWSGMGSDGYQTQTRNSWIPCKERAEKVRSIPTSRQGCWENTGRRLRRERGLRRERVSGPLVHRRRVEERRSPKFRRQRSKSFGPRWSSIENSREERQDKKSRVKRS